MADTNDEYELLPRDELDKLRSEIAQLKENPFGKAKQGDSLQDSITRLTSAILNLNTLLTKTNDEMLHDFNMGSLHDTLQTISSQNEKIARGILGLAKLVQKQDDILSANFKENVSKSAPSLDDVPSPNEPNDSFSQSDSVNSQNMQQMYSNNRSIDSNTSGSYAPNASNMNSSMNSVNQNQSNQNDVFYQQKNNMPGMSTQNNMPFDIDVSLENKNPNMDASFQNKNMNQEATENRFGYGQQFQQQNTNNQMQQPNLNVPSFEQVQQDSYMQQNQQGFAQQQNQAPPLYNQQPLQPTPNPQMVPPDQNAQFGQPPESGLAPMSIQQEPKKSFFGLFK